MEAGTPRPGPLPERSEDHGQAQWGKETHQIGRHRQRLEVEKERQQGRDRGQGADADQCHADPQREIDAIALPLRLACGGVGWHRARVGASSGRLAGWQHWSPETDWDAVASSHYPGTSLAVLNPSGSVAAARLGVLPGR